MRAFGASTQRGRSCSTGALYSDHVLPLGSYTLALGLPPVLHQQATGHGMGEPVGCWGCTQVSCLMKHLGVLGGIVASSPPPAFMAMWFLATSMVHSYQNFLWCNFVPVAALLDQHPAAALSPAAPRPLCLSWTDPALHCVGVLRRMHIKYKLTGRGCFVRKSSPQHK